jgi:anti-sigma factor RsiW
MNTKMELDLHAYVDGDLDEAAMARVEEYLRNNPEAALKIQAYLKQKDDIRGFAQKEVVTEDAPNAYRLGKKLAQQLNPKPSRPGKRTLALAFLFVAGWLGHMLYVPLVHGPAFTDEVVQAHLLSSSDPGEVMPLSPERISRLFARIGELEKLPDLRSLGFKPIGAQLLPSEEGMVLHVPYRDANGITVSYFLLHQPFEDEVEPQVLHDEGITIVYWQHDHSRYAVATPLPDEKVEQIVSLMEAAPVDL